MNNYLIKVERDSVCAGDDIDAPHAYSFEVPQGTTLFELFNYLSQRKYLASVAGVNHSWQAFIETEIIATFKGNSKMPVPSNTLKNQIDTYVINGQILIRFKYSSSRT